MSLIVDLATETYLRIAVKKAAAGFVYSNEFTLEQTWMPWETLENLTDQHPTGKVYVIGGTPGDLMNRSRSNLGLRDYSVQIGFQVVPPNYRDVTKINEYTNFMEELEYVCQHLVNLEGMSFSRLEYLRDPEGLPLSFLALRKAMTFESYFTAHYNCVIP